VVEDDTWRLQVLSTDGRRVGEVEVIPIEQGPNEG
jgi:hypothetical protein